MPLYRQHRISKADVMVNRHVIFLFGDSARRSGGMGELASILRGQPNAWGIIVKRSPTMTNNAFLRDQDLPWWEKEVEPVFRRIGEALENGLMVVLPAQGIASRSAQLAFRAPLIYKALQRHFELLDHVQQHLQNLTTQNKLQNLEYQSYIR